MQEKGKRPRNRKKRSIGKTLILLVVIGVLLGLILMLLPPRGRIDTPESSKRRPTELPKQTAAEQTAAEQTAARPTPVPSVSAQTTPPAGRLPDTPVRGKVALVLDDAGYSLEDLQPFLRTSLKLTIAVLPGLRYSAEAARLSRAAGKDVILHQPLEAVNGNALGPGGILTGEAEDVIRQTLAENIRSLPGLKGINNHMGSLGTTDPRVMDILMSVLQQQGLFFLDSRTTADSVAPEFALLHDVSFVQRDVFLDNEVTAGAIAVQLEEGLQLALTQGRAVLIGHVTHPLVMEVVYQQLPHFKNAGVEFVFLTEFL